MSRRVVWSTTTPTEAERAHAALNVEPERHVPAPAVVDLLHRMHNAATEAECEASS